MSHALSHLTFVAVGRMVLFPTEGLRRRAVRALFRVGLGRLVLFEIVDDHIHVVVACPTDGTGQLAQGLLLALRHLAEAEVRPAHVTPVEGRAHLERLVSYLLRQQSHHDLDAQPALWSGSCFSDLVGARVVGESPLRLVELLPRFRMRSAYAAVGLPAQPIEPATGAEVRTAGAARVVSAAAFAFAVGPRLEGVAHAVLRAKRAAAHLAREVDITSAEITWALGVDGSTVRRLRTKPIEPRLLRAVRMRIAIENVVGLAPRRAA